MHTPELNALTFLICVWAIKTVVATPLVGPRIINGEKAIKGQFPWQAAISISQTSGSKFCGGALISDRWVLTAGHCVQYAISFTIALGSNALVGEDTNRVVVSSNQFIKHENYNSMTLANDVAVILLPNAVPFNENIQPISLSSSELLVGSVVSVSGWGLTRDTDIGASLHLNYVNLRTISNSECSKVYGNLNKGVVCVTSLGSTVQSSCEGDSGGPVVAYSFGKPIHVGLVSFGHSDGCESGQPSAFSETFYYREWIRTMTGV